MNTEHMLKLRGRNWHQPVWLTAALLCLLSSFSLFWYFNAPIYDFISMKVSKKQPSNVVLIDLGARFSEDEKLALQQELLKFSPSKIVTLQNEAAETELAENERVYIPFVNLSVRSKGRVPPLSGRNNSYVLAPQDDSDGIVRYFDSQQYVEKNLKCAPCELVKESSDQSLTINSQQQFLIRFNHGKVSLPTFDYRQITQGQIPANILANKIFVVDALGGVLKPLYRTNYFLDQKVSYTYYLSSVIDNLESGKGHKVLSPIWLGLLLIVVGALFILVLRNLSLTSGGVLLVVTTVVIVMANVATIRYLGIFIPVFEFFAFSLMYIFYAINRRDVLVRSNLNTSNTQLQLSLSETTDPTSQNETLICGSLFNFFGRACEVKSLVLYDVRRYSDVTRLVGLNEQILGEEEFKSIESQITGNEIKNPIQLSRDSSSPELLFAVPIRQRAKGLALLVLDVHPNAESDAAAVLEKIATLQAHYQDELYQEVAEWFHTYRKSTRQRLAKDYLHHGRLATLSYVNIQLVERLLNQYQRMKNNYHRLNSAVAVYDIYGSLVSINESAEAFAQKAQIAWYGSSLVQILGRFMEVSDGEIKELINEVLIHKRNKRFTLDVDGSVHHVATLSLRHLFRDQGNLKLTETSYLTLEITDVSNIGTAAKLKHSYVNNLTHQIKQDLSKLSLLVDKLSLLDENSEKYNYLAEVISQLNQRVKSSKHYIEDLAKIESSPVYSVNIMEKLDEALSKFEGAFSEKGIKLVYDRPTFLSHVVLNYRDLEFVFSYLLELLVEDSLHNSKLEIRLEEIKNKQSHFIILLIQNSGYGLPKDIFEGRVGESRDEQPINQCREFASVHGGAFDITSTAGEGIRVKLELPVDHTVH